MSLVHTVIIKVVPFFSVEEAAVIQKTCRPIPSKMGIFRKQWGRKVWNLSVVKSKKDTCLQAQKYTGCGRECNPT
jgi:hypothetical protein